MLLYNSISVSTRELWLVIQNFTSDCSIAPIDCLSVLHSWRMTLLRACILAFLIKLIKFLAIPFRVGILILLQELIANGTLHIPSFRSIHFSGQLKGSFGLAVNRYFGSQYSCSRTYKAQRLIRQFGINKPLIVKYCVHEIIKYKGMLFQFFDFFQIL